MLTEDYERKVFEALEHMTPQELASILIEIGCTPPKTEECKCFLNHQKEKK